MSENHDDYDFIPTSNSSLASLFDASGELSDNPSLIYTAPKQPKNPSRYTENKMADKKPESKIVCAFIATVWKWSDCKYESFGKLGVAIIGSEVYNSYELIIYKSKTNVIVQMRINQNFQITFNRDQFLTFYDNSKQNWLIKFSTDRDLAVITGTIEKYGGKIITKLPETEESNENSNKQQQQKSPTFKDDKIEENRADILTRIAKLGQSILPITNQDIKTNTEETEDDSLRTDHDVASISSNDDCVNQSITPSHNINVTPIQTRQCLPNSMPTTTTTTTSFVMNSSISYDPISLLFTENRTNNSEIRINLNQITDKLNQVLQIVSDDKKRDDNNNNNNSNTNEELSKTKIKVLQLKIENLNKEIEESTRKHSELQQKYNNQQEIIKRLQQETNEQSRNGDKNLLDKKELFVGKIKVTMSDMYDDIKKNFEANENTTTTTTQINVIAQNIKQTTKKIVQQYHEIHNSN